MGHQQGQYGKIIDLVWEAIRQLGHSCLLLTYYGVPLIFSGRTSCICVPEKQQAGLKPHGLEAILPSHVSIQPLATDERTAFECMTVETSHIKIRNTKQFQIKTLIFLVLRLPSCRRCIQIWVACSVCVFECVVVCCLRRHWSKHTENTPSTSSSGNTETSGTSPNY